MSITINHQTNDISATNGSLSVGGGALSNRNKIINGNPMVRQRTTSAQNLGSGGQYAADRFFGQLFGSSGMVCSHNISTDVPTNDFSGSYFFDVTTAATNNDYVVNITSRVEGYEAKSLLIPYSGNKATLSFWVKSSQTGSYCITLSTGYRGGATYNFAYKVVSYAVNSANTWEKKTIVIDTYDTAGSAAWNTTNGNGLEITFNIGIGSTYSGVLNPTIDVWNDTSSTGYFLGASGSNQQTWGQSTADSFYITGIQLEAGDTATPFEHRSYGDELLRCQRYYYQTDSYKQSLSSLTNVATLLWHSYAKGASTWEFQNASFPTTMRASPTLTYSDVAGTVGKISHATSIGGAYSNNHNAYSAYATTNVVRISDYFTGSIYGFGFEYAVDAEL